jgi:hypothetical protein
MIIFEKILLGPACSGGDNVIMPVGFTLVGATILGFLLSTASVPALDFKETIRNGLYPLKDNERVLTLDLKLSIDMERPDILASGMGISGEFDVDSNGDIYVVAFRSKENFIYRFDASGKLLNSFGKFGQGPGEIQWPFSPTVMNAHRLALFDGQLRRYSIFSDQGVCLKEKAVPNAFQVDPVVNGNYLIMGHAPIYRTAEFYTVSLTLYDHQFRNIKELDRREYSLDGRGFVPFFMWRATKKYIYVVNENRGYEIWVYDLDGNPVRKITKEFRPVPVTEELFKLILGPDALKNRTLHKSYFPNPMPPMSQFFVDDEDRVYVLTYEHGAGQGEYMVDIFDDRGTLISRIPIYLVWAGHFMGPHYAFGKNGFLYFYREKENGFNALYKYKMTWTRPHY